MYSFIFFQDGVGFKMFEIHFINVSSFGQHVVNFLKQFVKPKIMERFVCHENSENLHKYIPKKYLPKDYGGEQPSLNDMKGVGHLNFFYIATHIIHRC